MIKLNSPNLKGRNKPTRAIDSISSSTPSSELSTKPVVAMSVDPRSLVINQNNQRKTFKNYEEFDKFLAKINFPKDAFDFNEEGIDLIDWVESHPMRAQIPLFEAFKHIIKRALSIKQQGQLQPILASEDSGSYRVIAGSTRALACYLLKQPVELKLTSYENELEELSAHISENTQRSDLTFAEELQGYLKYFELRIESGSLAAITRAAIMRELGMPRTTAARWNNILNAASTDKVYLDWLIQDASSVRDAAIYLDKLKNPDAEEGEGSDLAERAEPSASPRKKYNTTNKVQFKGAAKDTDLFARYATNLLLSEYEYACTGTTDRDRTITSEIKIYLKSNYPFMTKKSAQNAVDFVTTLLMDYDISLSDNMRVIGQRMDAILSEDNDDGAQD